MPYSMTGFASAATDAAPFRFVWELRSVNHRFLDVNFRLPEELRALEPKCRDTAAGYLHRGKVDCVLKVAVATGAAQRTHIVDAPLGALRALSERVRSAFPDAAPLTVAEILRWPGVLEEPQQDPGQLTEPVLRALAQALIELQQSRRREGERMAELLERRNAAVLALVESIRPGLRGIEDRYRAKLEERLRRLDIQANPERLEQELVLVAQRLDVSEEVDRLAAHVEEIRAVLVRDEPVGRRLDFLMQELNREANTLTSKAQDEQLTRAAVDIKVLIEQMREQVQNLE